MLKLFKWFFIACCLWFLVHSIIVTVTGLKNYDCKTKVGVILGNKVNEDGSLSLRLQARLDKGVSLFQNGTVKRLIVSGGLGKEGYWEGDKMKEYLVSRNIPDSLIIVDNYGVNTEASAINTKNLLDSLNEKQEVTVISQFYHLHRSRMLFKKQGLEHVCIASPSYFEFKDFYSLFREFFAFYWELI